jgi:hypothetical protein
MNGNLVHALREAARDPRNWDIRGLLEEAASAIDIAPRPRSGPPQGYRSGRWVIRDGHGFPPP